MWMASNLDYKNLTEAFAEINPSLTKKPANTKKPDVTTVNKDWGRLKMFMSGRK